VHPGQTHGGIGRGGASATRAHPSERAARRDGPWHQRRRHWAPVQLDRRPCIGSAVKRPRGRPRPGGRQPRACVQEGGRREHREALGGETATHTVVVPDHLGCGHIVASAMEVPNILANLVRSG
jgi:hypothetical protein